jgi:hypothetical protein
MNLSSLLPDWLPWWVPLVVLVPVVLYLAVFLVMPFSVFGLKGRLDLIDARLDEIQGEIRALSLRLPEPDRRVEARPPLPPASPQPLRRPAPPPVESADWEEEEEPREPPARRPRPPGQRMEPRLDWPR